MYIFLTTQIFMVFIEFNTCYLLVDFKKILIFFCPFNCNNIVEYSNKYEIT
jgi:hypothetical protein